MKLQPILSCCLLVIALFLCLAEAGRCHPKPSPSPSSTPNFQVIDCRVQPISHSCVVNTVQRCMTWQCILKGHFADGCFRLGPGRHQGERKLRSHLCSWTQLRITYVTHTSSLGLRAFRDLTNFTDSIALSICRIPQLYPYTTNTNHPPSSCVHRIRTLGLCSGPKPFPISQPH